MIEPGTPAAPAVEVAAASAGQEPVLANLFELYAHDFSEFAGLQLGLDGRFGAPGLSRCWQEETLFPFLVNAGGRLAGFAIVSKGSRISGDPGVWDMEEFFVVRGHRRHGVGAAAAQELWRRFPGRWEIRVMESNRPARAFWAAAVRAFAGAAEGVMMELHGKPWEVFSFTSP